MSEFRDRDPSVGTLEDARIIAGEQAPPQTGVPAFVDDLFAVLSETQIRAIDSILLAREHTIVHQLASMEGVLTLDKVQHLHSEAKAVMLLRMVTNRLKPREN